MDIYQYKVSIIVPVYNAGPYLKSCLDSLVCQTLNGIQIIVVLDCPTDGSDILVDQYANKYSNIEVIRNHSNLHVGDSRNVALNYVQGKYVGFFDHDDYGELNMYELMYNIAEKDESDMVYSPFVSIDDNGRKISLFEYPQSLDISATDLYKTTIGLSLNDNTIYTKLSAPKTIWNKLYRTDIIKHNNIKFVNTKVATPEDTPFNIEYMYYCKRISVLPTKLYYHVYHGSNTGNSVDYKSMKKYAEALNIIYYFLEAKGELQKNELKERFDNTVRLNVFVTFFTELKQVGAVQAINDLFAIKKKYKFIRDSYKRHSKIMLVGGYSLKVNFVSWIISIILKKII